MSEKPLLTLDDISRSHERFANIKYVPVKLEVDCPNCKANGTEDCEGCFEGVILKEFEVEMYKVFSPIGVKECLAEFIRNMDFAKNVDRDGFGNIMESYFMFLLMKHFTNLKDEMPNDFKKQLEVMNHMMNTTAFYQIMIHFDEREIQRITEELEILMATSVDNFNLIEEIKKAGKQFVRNEELLE